MTEREYTIARLIRVYVTMFNVVVLLLSSQPVAALTYFSLSYFLLKLWSFLVP
jgi:hypothetical protein